MSKSLRTHHHDAYKIMYMCKSAEMSSLNKMKLSMIIKNNNVRYMSHLVCMYSKKHNVNHKSAFVCQQTSILLWWFW